MLKIIADENIPLVDTLFGAIGDITLLPGREIQNKHLKHADILLVRSVTSVNADLLANTSVRFVGSATTGIDHVDTQWLQQNGIIFADAQGCNAEAVAEYVLCCIATLEKLGHLTHSARIGIVGVGRVGKRIASHLQQRGYSILLNDPPRAENESHFISAPLTDFFNVDLICLHTPLTQHGPFPTYHLFNAEILNNLRPNCVVLNAGRGATVDSRAVLTLKKPFIYCFDVWENEPYLNKEILMRATIATPHIAGYTVEAKIRGTLMLYQAAKSIFALPGLSDEAKFFPKISLKLADQTTTVNDVLLQLYDPLSDTAKLKENPQHFDYLRKHYRQRHEFSSVLLSNCQSLSFATRNTLKELGFVFDATL